MAEGACAVHVERRVGADGADLVHCHALKQRGVVAIGFPAERQWFAVIVADDVVVISDGDAAIAVFKAGHRPFGRARVIDHLLRLPAAMSVGIAAASEVVVDVSHQLLLLELLLLDGSSGALLHHLRRRERLSAGSATEQGEEETGISRHGGNPQGCGTL